MAQKAGIGKSQFLAVFRQPRNYLSTDTTASSTADASGNNLTSFNANGFSLAITTGGGLAKATNEKYVSWTFRKAAKFFDFVTYTGNLVNGRAVAHSLGSIPGMIIIKRTAGAVSNWIVYHRSIGYTNSLFLNTTDLLTGQQYFTQDPTASNFYLPNSGTVNNTGDTYVAYLFAHDTSTNGIIQCGSYTGTGAPQDIYLGWEPQFLLVKRTTGTQNWFLIDDMRGLGSSNIAANQNVYTLSANALTSESPIGDTGKSSTGIYLMTNSILNYSGDTYIYMAIRRPNKPPTSGTQVYNAIARTGNSVKTSLIGVGFAPDWFLHKWRSNGGSGESLIYDRLRGVGPLLNTAATAIEANYYDGTHELLSYDPDGITVGINTQTTLNANAQPEVFHFFKRAPGVFDQVCFQGSGSSITNAYHSLGVLPELVIVKTCIFHEKTSF